MSKVKMVELPKDVNKAVEIINSLGVSTRISKQVKDWKIYMPRIVKDLLESQGFRHGDLVMWRIEAIEKQRAVIRLEIVKMVGAETEAVSESESEERNA